MKKFFFVIFTLVLAAPLYSQVQFGIKAGVSTDFTFTDQTFEGTDIDVIIQSAEDAEPLTLSLMKTSRLEELLWFITRSSQNLTFRFF
jgi:hypothetical protein